jgi:hypothetical protein
MMKRDTSNSCILRRAATSFAALPVSTLGYGPDHREIMDDPCIDPTATLLTVGQGE